MIPSRFSNPVTNAETSDTNLMCHSTAGVGNYFTRRARFGKTVEAAGRTLIGKQGEDLFFFEITVHLRM